MKLDYFAEKLGVSTRTIRNDIKDMEKEYEKNGFCLENKAKLGYILKVSDEEKFKSYLEKLPDYIVESPEQRLDSIVVELLLNDGYKTIESLSSKFLVSISQIKNDLKKIDDKLLKYNLKLERKPHYGIKIEGSIESVHKILEKEYLKSNRNFIYYKDKYLNKEKINSKKSTMKSIFKNNNLDVNISELKEISNQMIILYIKTSIRMSSENYRIEVKEDNEIVKSILDEVFGENKYYFTLQENDYLRKLIIGKTRDKKKVKIVSDKSKLNDIIYNYFEDVDKKYKTNFLKDQEFLKLLYLHIAALIERAKKNQTVSNPFSMKISQQYPTVFNLAIQLSKLIEKEYDVKINQNEIGFIATHIAVPFEKREKYNFSKRYRIAIVCSSGGGSAFLIKLRLSEIFQNAEIENFSLLDEEKVIEFEPHLIFSITELSFKVDAPVILISEILDELDNLDIKERVMLVNHMNNIKDPKDYILSLFNKNHFRCIKEEKEYKEILYSMAQDVVDDEACSKTFPDDVWERESCLSTIYKNGVAIPHPIEMTGNKNIISVGLVQSDVKDIDNAPKVIFMISLIKGNIELHRQISRYLDKIMNNKELVDMLNKSQSYEEFIYKLKVYIGG